jgi:pimeloyl-ACP methyl ester carboxylesterase
MFIAVDDARLYTLAFGPRTGTPVLALSGWTGSWEDWAGPLSLLSEDLRVISYDHRGSGATVAPVESITFDRLVDDVFAVLDAHGVDQCILAAMSMGAGVAFGAALRDPSRISGLVLANPISLRGGPRESDPFFQALNEDYPQAVDRFVNACVPEPDSDHIKRWGRQILDRASQDAALALYRMGMSIDLRNDLGRITQPTLIIHGDADLIASLESARWLAETLPNARLVVLEGAGHAPIMTRPHDVAREIRSFLGD